MGAAVGAAVGAGQVQPAVATEQRGALGYLDRVSAERAIVITVSDRCARGEATDRSGARAVELLTAAGYTVDEPTIIADGARTVTAELRRALAKGARLIVTSGGTGIGPNDFTPEGTVPLLQRQLPGLAEGIRHHGAADAPHAVLSRAVAGVTDQTLIVNLPGSVAAVESALSYALPLIPHILQQLTGGDHL